VSDPVRELQGLDAQIVDELQRSRQALSPLLKQREEIVREACASRPESLADAIISFATERAPATFTPSEVFLYVRERLGASVMPNLITAWLTKLVRSEKLVKRKRGVYALS
jgi:hypothetical protein